LKKGIKLTLKIISAVFIFILLLYVGVSLYVTYNKKQIINQALLVIKEKVRGNISMGDVDLDMFGHFPSISVSIKNILLTDSLYHIHKRPLLKVSELDLTLQVFRVLAGKQAVSAVYMKDGVIDIFTDQVGYTNKYILAPKNPETAPREKSVKEYALQDLYLRNIQIIIEDGTKKKRYDFLAHTVNIDFKQSGADMILNTKADIGIHVLTFKTDRNRYLENSSLKGNFIARINAANHLVFNNIPIQLAKHPFHVTGDFNMGRDNPYFKIQLHTTQISYDKIKSMVPARIKNSLSMVSLDKPLNADAYITGPLRGGQPHVILKWEVRNSKMATHFMDFENVNFTGSFTNEISPGLPRRDPNSKIALQHFTANWHGLAVQMKNIEIQNLLEPVLTADLNADFKLSKLNSILENNTLNLQDGEADLALHYHGPLKRDENTNSFIDGQVAIKNGSLVYEPRNVKMQDMNSLILFKNNDLMVQNLECKVKNTQLKMDGTASNFLKLINTDPAKVIIDWNIFTPSADLGSFIFLFQQRKNERKNRASTGSLASITNKIDNLFEQGSLQVNFTANEIRYKKFTATRLVSNFSVSPNIYTLNKISMQHAGGTVDISGAINQVSDKTNRAKINAILNHVNVATVFYSFDNFGQTGIESQNLNGQLTATVNTQMNLDANGKIMPRSIDGQLSFSLKNGVLKHYEPIMKIQDFIFKKRNFDSIAFAELKDTWEIQNGEVRINRMEIQSSVLSMYIEGIYSMRGNTDLSIQIPFSNLKKRKDNEVPKNKGVNAKTGSSLYLRGRNTDDGTVKLSLDLFKKYFKDKEKRDSTGK